MLTKNINFKNFQLKKKKLNLKKKFLSIVNDENQVINSLTNYYRNSYSKKFVKLG